MLERHRLRRLLLACSVLIVSLLTQGGCKKTPPPPQGVSAFLAFPGKDVNPDGTLNQTVLDTLASKAAEPALGVKFVRSALSDAGLLQLTQFKNIRQVDAAGSKITDDGVAKLKEALPDVIVVK